MRVVVYVEGPSDQRGLEALCSAFLAAKRSEGVSVNFFPSPAGDKKATLLTKVPIKAANMLLNDADSVVVAMPDLYPKNKGFPHQTPDELREGMLERFKDAVSQKSGSFDDRLNDRFRVFCFKYDFEALLLAAEESLFAHCRFPKRTWRIPVENQNHDMPPKRVVQALFESAGKKYEETLHVPLILRSADLAIVAERLPQEFGRFVAFLTTLRA